MAELHIAIAAHPSAIRTRLYMWRACGLIFVEDSSPLSYRLNDTARQLGGPPVRTRQGALTRRRSTQQQRIWTAMRVLKRFDVPTLEMAAGGKRQATAAFVSALFKAGYLRRIVEGGSNRGLWSSYQLIRDSGPAAPRATFDQADRSRKIVIDGNTGERFERVAPPKRQVNHVR